MALPNGTFTRVQPGVYTIGRLGSSRIRTSRPMTSLVCTEDNESLDANRDTRVASSPGVSTLYTRSAADMSSRLTTRDDATDDGHASADRGIRKHRSELESAPVHTRDKRLCSTTKRVSVADVDPVEKIQCAFELRRRIRMTRKIETIESKGEVILWLTVHWLLMYIYIRFVVWCPYRDGAEPAYSRLGLIWY